MVSNRSCAGPTGQPGLHVADTCDALTAATEPTNPAESVAGSAAGVSAVVGDAVTAGAVEGGVVIGGTVVVRPGTAVTWEWVWRVAIRAVLEQAVSSPHRRRPVAPAT